MHTSLQPLVGDLALNDEAYSRTFDLTEYLLALICWSHRPGWAPIGRHAWRWPRHEKDQLSASVEAFTAELLARGLFADGREQLDQAIAGYQDLMVRSGIRWP